MCKKIKLSVLFVLAISFLIALSGCGDNNSSYEEALPENTISSDAEQATESPLAIYDGWWYRPKGYTPEGISIVDIFEVDAENGTWTVYNEYGFAGETLSCYGDESSLILDLSEFGQVVLFPNGTNLIDENRKVHFVRGEEPQPQFNQATLAGIWYESGMTEDYESRYVFRDTSYEHRFANDEALSSGSFEMGTYLDSNLPYVALSDPTSMFGYANYMLVDGKLLYDTFKGEFFVHESVTETPQGTQYTNIGRLLCGDWTDDKEYDGIPGVMIDFGDAPNGRFAYITWVAKDDNYTSQEDEAGKWQVTENGTLLLTFLDGTAEEVNMSGETFTVQYYGITFTDDSDF